MKKYILLFLFISTAIFAQDYSKLKNSQLVDSISKKNEIIRSLNIKISELNKQVELKNKKNESNNIEKLKNIIKDDNNYWLKDLFEKKYTDTYFAETDIESEDISQKITKSNVYILSIKSVEENIDIIEKCNKALNFNENYKALYTIQNTVLNEMYNEKNINEAISSIEKLPKLLTDSKLDKRKTRIQNALKNYLDSTCRLKKKLDNYKDAECKSTSMQKAFTLLENDDYYKEYVYLLKVIRKMKNNKIDYTKDDLQPCEDIENPTTETAKPAAIKESSPLKEEKPKADTTK